MGVELSGFVALWFECEFSFEGVVLEVVEVVRMVGEQSVVLLLVFSCDESVIFYALSGRQCLLKETLVFAHSPSARLMFVVGRQCLLLKSLAASSPVFEVRPLPYLHHPQVVRRGPTLLASQKLEELSRRQLGIASPVPGHSQSGS